MEQAHEPEFAAAAEITKGPLYLRGGVGAVTVDHGLLTMRKPNGDFIVSEVAMSEVRAHARRGDFGGKVLVRVAKSKYILEWVTDAAQVNFAGITAVAGVETAQIADVGATVARLPKQREITDGFLAVVAANGGQVA
jgi:hypothetical protein